MQETARKVEAVRDALDFALEMIQPITLSPKLQELFETKQKKEEGYVAIISPSVQPDGDSKDL